jgi:hypothetical protein
MESITLLNLSFSVLVISQITMMVVITLGMVYYGLVKIHDKLTGKTEKEHQRWLECRTKMEAEHEARQLAKLLFWKELNDSCK